MSHWFKYLLVLFLFSDGLAIGDIGVSRSTLAAKSPFNRKAITEGFQDHHIISDKNALTKNHELLDAADFDLQSRANKIFLPEEASLHPTRSIHSGRHTTGVSRNLAVSRLSSNGNRVPRKWHWLDALAKA